MKEKEKIRELKKKVYGLSSMQTLYVIYDHALYYVMDVENKEIHLIPENFLYDTKDDEVVDYSEHVEMFVNIYERDTKWSQIINELLDQTPLDLVWKTFQAKGTVFFLKVSANG